MSVIFAKRAQCISDISCTIECDSDDEESDEPKNDSLKKIFQCFISELFKCEEAINPANKRIYYKLDKDIFRKVKIRGIVTDYKKYTNQTSITGKQATSFAEYILKVDFSS